MTTVADYLIDRLKQAGVRHVFGIPGDYVLDFYDQLWNAPGIEVVNTTDEAHAGFAADAYARVNGIGCACVTYNVGALKLANSVACAYAERSPMVIISGSPGIKERDEGMLLHHMVRSFTCQAEIFANITCDSVVLDHPGHAAYLIDRALMNLNHYKQPVYIELPRDVVNLPINLEYPSHIGAPVRPKSDAKTLEEAVREVYALIEEAERPVILAGVEVARYGLSDALLSFAEKTNLPVATELLSKSVFSERHPLFAGLYSGGSSDEFTRELVEESDCLLMFGVLLTDMTLNFMPTRFKKRRSVSCSLSGLQVKNHVYQDVQFQDFCEALWRREFTRREKPVLQEWEDVAPFVPTDAIITTKRLLHKIQTIMDERSAIIADVGDSLFGALQLRVHHSNQFLSPAFYTSMGTAIPGALGFGCAMPSVRPIVLVGDGAFQMTMTELSTILRLHQNPILFVLNNDGYSTERLLKDGGYNDLPEWNYHRIADIFGSGGGSLVFNEKELEEAVSTAIASNELHIINVKLARDDYSETLKRMTTALAKRV